MTAALVEANMTPLSKVGIYSGYVGMYGLAGQPVGVDYTVGCRYDDAKPNKDVTFGWRLPSVWAGGVRGYLHSDYGNYDYSNPPTLITPRKAGQITELTTTIDYQAVGDPFSMLLECYLTTAPHSSGPLDDKILEIGVFPFVSPDTIFYIDNATFQLGTFVDPQGRSWKCAYYDTFVMFRPIDNQPIKGVVRFKSFIDFVLANRAGFDQGYFNGIGFGPEPRLGNGTAKLSMAVDDYR